MSRFLVSHFLLALDDAFEGDGEHSLLANLRNVDDAVWHAVRDCRSIAEIAEHAGRAKFVYENFAFGNATLTWENPFFPPAAARSRDETLAWLRQGHRRLAESAGRLDAAGLAIPLPVHYGGPPRPASDILAMLARHDVYHAGEINHLRSILQGNDRWDFYA